MGKLRLNLDEVSVESFETVDAAEAPRGTVRAHDDSGWYETWEPNTCQYAETCAHWHTCYQDCSMDCTFVRCTFRAGCE
ncbi:MAG TPA: hypothetical protein VFQ45_19790 [Longimicrobium sp.]|nr:hypothetical protein [Longimicrobium sp.]